MTNEPETNPKTSRGCTPLSIFYYRPLVQGISWIGGISVLSSGFVWAHSEPLAPPAPAPTTQKAPRTVIVNAEPVPIPVPKPVAFGATTSTIPQRNPETFVAHQPTAPEQNPKTIVVNAIPVPAKKPQLTPVNPIPVPAKKPQSTAVKPIPVPQDNSEPVVADHTWVTPEKPLRQESRQAPTVTAQPATQEAIKIPVVLDKPMVIAPITTASVPKQPTVVPPNFYVPTRGDVAIPAFTPNLTAAKNSDTNSTNNNSLGVTNKDDLSIRSEQTTTDADAGIVIPVPPPESTRVAQAQDNTAGIVIPVPPPESTKVAQAQDNTAGIVIPVPQPETAKIGQASVPKIPAISSRPRGSSTSGFSRSTGNTTTVPPEATASGFQPYYNPLNLAAGLLASNNSNVYYPLTLPAEVTSPFGWRIHPISGASSFHAGTDLGAPMGAPVLAAASGQVISANWMGGYGNAIVIQHNQTQETLYGHLSEINVQPGQRVEPGMVIGRVGSTGYSTGPHLHFEMRQRTNAGWEATDSAGLLQLGMAQLSNAMHTAQATAPVKG